MYVGIALDLFPKFSSNMSPIHEKAMKHSPHRDPSPRNTHTNFMDVHLCLARPRLPLDGLTTTIMAKSSTSIPVPVAVVASVLSSNLYLDVISAMSSWETTPSD